MLDIKFVRENPEVVKQNIRNKFQDSKLELVDKVLELDKENREIKQEVEALRAERNKISKQIGALMQNLPSAGSKFIPNETPRSVLLWAREKEKRQKRLKSRLLHPEPVLRNFPRERKRLRKSF